MADLNDASLLYDVAYSLLVAAEQALVDIEAAPIARSFVAPGDGTLASWDNCCGGQLIVAVEEVYQASPFPQANGTPSKCGTRAWAARYLIQVARCAPTIGDDETGDVPLAVEPEALAETAWRTMSDAWAIARGVECFLGTIVDDDEYLMGSITPNGPSGNCVAYDLRVTIELGTGCGCDIGPPESV